jgi:uncharacterized membrane protein
MRSWHELAIAALLAAGCGGGESGNPPPGDPGACETSYLEYKNFGQPFLLDWCSGCHSAALPATMRQMAPADVNFDTIDGVRRFQERIAARATGATPTMPPAGGPSEEERAMLAEWLNCGTR